MENNYNSDGSDSVDTSMVPTDNQIKLLEDGTNLNHYQETPVQDNSNNDVRNSSPSRRKLDERITSRISQLIYRAPSNVENGELEETLSSRDKESAIKVLKLKSISNLVTSNQFQYQYGVLTALSVGDFIALGTSKGHILTFDFHQNSQTVFQEKRSLESGSITALSVSADSTYIAAGFENGSIFVWDTRKPSNVILSIPGLEQRDLAKGTKEGHLAGSKIHHINFIGKRHTALISADNRGLLCYHNGYRNVLGYHVISRKIIGKYSYDMESKAPILASKILPLGTSVEATDSIGLTAIITPHALIVISIYPQMQTHFKVGRPSGISKTSPITAAISWLPALALPGSKSSPLKLCYCWTNVMTVFEINHEVMKNRETNEESVFVKFVNKKRWIGREGIVAIQWLNSKIIAALTNGNRLLLISEASMQVLSSVDLLGKHICSLELFDRDLFENSFANSFISLKSKIFILSDGGLFVTSLSNWADNLTEIIKEGDYLGALKRARKFYLDDDEDLIIYGLPHTVSERKDVLLNNVLQLMSASLDYIFKNLDENYEMNPNLLNDFLHLYFQIYVDFDGEIGLERLDSAFEHFNDADALEVFFDILKGFVLREQIVKLTPTILKLLVKHFASSGRGDQLEELICLLDITSLDIDLTVSLCEEFHLRDSLVFIWNVLLGDYVTPFFDFINTIVKYNDVDQESDEKQLLRVELSKVFGYLSYILTGRQYPTERLIDFEKLRSAKMNLYYVLFNGASLAWPKGGSKIHVVKDIHREPAFPYLFLLLKFNCFETLGALNEIFEDELLNEDGPEYEGSTSDFELKATRQYIIGILFDVFKSNNLEFSELDITYLSIFVARNYPKFFQFIHLSDSTCEELIETLCSFPDANLKEDCELSLQSLLSVYHPLNVDDHIYFFEKAGFYDVLFNVYRSEQKFHKVLEIWLANKERSQLENEVLHKKLPTYEKDSDIVRKCFELTKSNQSERKQVEEFIMKHFVSLVADDMGEMIRLFSKFCPEINGEILKIENDGFCYEYLKILFQEHSLHGATTSLQQQLKIKYVKMLSKFDKQTAFSFLHDVDSDHQIKELIPFLRENGAIDSVILLLENTKQYGACIDELSKYMSTVKEDILKILKRESPFEMFTEIEEELWKYLFMGIKVCDYDMDNKYANDTLSLNEWLWLTLVESTVDLLKAVNTELSGKDLTRDESYILDNIKRLVQDLFANLINSRSADDISLDWNHSDSSSVKTIQPKKLSFFNVFNEFLNDSAASPHDSTKLSDLRMILNEIFVSYKHDTVLQKTILGLVTSRIFSEFEMLNLLKLKGLTSKKSECDACGKALWGSYISNDVYDSWRDNQLLKLNEEIDLEDSDSNSVTIFKCGHGYHGHCLLGLGGNNKPAEQLTQLTTCANDVLSKLDVCKPDDLACECCALQSMDQRCFGLCRKSPSASFLDQLITDCESLSEVNACGLPFKKSDKAEAKISRKTFRAGSRKPTAKVEERVKSVVGVSSSEKKSSSNERVNVKSKVPGPIVLSSRIKNNITEDFDDATNFKGNKSNVTIANSTTCEEESLSPVSSVYQSFIYAILMVNLVVYLIY